ncbi:MAG: type II toxin-antitoxin system RelE/ParE family toxin [Pyrinomonadaceae bacterium]|nr:type II toxin-antitoxin system RelE/ParE family toxin [Pyrinomonadaceae bacterium]
MESVLSCSLVIESFKNAATDDIYNGRNSAAARRLLPRSLWKVAARKMDMIDGAIDLDDLRVPPGNRLEALKADRTGQYSVRINEQYRICFEWSADGRACNVEIVDYH